jgi:hypothetical protein
LLKTSSRRQFLFAITATGALVAAGGAAWAAWYLGGSGSASTRSASALGLELSAHPRPDMPLYPGARTDLSVAVRNPNPFPVVVTNVRVGTGPVTVDAAHRGAGCVTTGVLATRGATAVSLTVPANSSATFLLPDAIQMTNDSDSACQGATFTVPLTASGRSGAN